MINGTISMYDRMAHSKLFFKFKSQSSVSIIDYILKNLVISNDFKMGTSLKLKTEKICFYYFFIGTVTVQIALTSS